MPDTDYNTLELERKGRREFLIATLMGYSWGDKSLERLEEIIHLLGIEE